ncbi:MAG: HDOD domain-containing protein [Planctomycetaceae bacterium]
MRLLFIDDEPQVLRGIQRMLDGADVDWNCEFVNSGEAALHAMNDGDFDAIVSDMRMPGMDGARLLEEVSRQHPEVIRIILSGEADKQSVMRAVNPMHQFLSKPCSAETLKRTLSRACALRAVLQGESLSQLVGGVVSLPSMPALYTRLMEEINSADATVAGVGRIVSQDPGMTAKILKLANSAIFGLGRPVSSPAAAASLLGMDTIKALVLSAEVFQKFDGVNIDGFSIDDLYQHSLEVAQFSSRVAKAEKLETNAVNDAFTAGVLHDIGKLLLATSAPQMYEQATRTSREQHLALWQAECGVFGASHAALGAHLLSLWSLPQTIVEIVALHHSPGESHDASFTALSAVCVGNLLSHAGHQPLDETEHNTCLQYLTEIRCADKLALWQKICQAGGE